MASSPSAPGEQTTMERATMITAPFEDDNSVAGSPVATNHSNALSKDAKDANLDSTMNSSVATSTASDDDSEGEVRRPVGRAARRMLGGDRSGTSSPQQTSTFMQPLMTATFDAGDDELYTATPKRSVRARSKSPSIQASAARSTLFVSPARTEREGSDDDLAGQSTGLKSKLAALVAEKRAARLAREADDESRRLDSAHASSDLPHEMVQGSQEPLDPEVERIMSDAVKPTRKASKRALLEMERETQRMARQQALAHQMKTRKKFTTNDLFAKFNYRPVGQVPPAQNDADTSASSAPNSDAPAREPFSTPPSSPPTPLDRPTPFQRQQALVEKGALSKMVPIREDSLSSVTEMPNEDELPDITDIFNSAREVKTAEVQPIVTMPSPSKIASKKGLKLARLGKKAVAPTAGDGSDDDLEIVKEMPRHLNVFDKAKGTLKRQHADSTAIHRLKHLAQVGMDDTTWARRKMHGKAQRIIGAQAIEQQLLLRAKEQARAEQLERIAELQAKGIVVQTSEEREREQEIFENLLDKARLEAVELRKAEKNAAKGGNGDAAASDDESEDEDYVDGSGSEGEHADEAGSNNDMVDDIADESEDEGEEDDDANAEVEEEETIDDSAGTMGDATTGEAHEASAIELLTRPSPAPTPMVGRKSRKSRIIVDDEDSDDDVPQQLPNATPIASATQDDPFAAFGFGAAKAASSLMSPTQMFNATMQTPTQLTQQDSLDVLNHLVPPTSSSLPPVSLNFEGQTFGDTQVDMIPGSQIESQPIKLAWETQPPETPVQTMKRGSSNLTLETPGWEPSQDAGLPEAWQATAGLEREDTLGSASAHDTQSTVRLRISESPAAVATKRNRHVRGRRVAAEESDGDDDAAPVESSKQEKKNAFREMARKRREALTEAERAEAEREAKAMMEDQAEESEDEYAGLGGDDYVAPETEQDREMIDSSHVEVDERQLAAHFAERQRAEDEAGANKLLRDLQTGALRRKQANMFDLDDDEDDLAVRRRQMRQREEARKRKLLLQDDNIAGLAEGKQSKGKDAFLRAIADDDDRDDDALDLSDGGEDEQMSQSDSQASQQPTETSAPLREVSVNNMKRRRDVDSQERPSANKRRTQASAFKAPTSLLEVKQSVSFLLDEPNVPLAAPTAMENDSGSEKEDGEATQHNDEDDDVQAMEEEASRQNDGGFAPDRIAMPPPRLPASQRRTAAKPAVVDRLSLKRVSSANDSAHSRTAWAAPAGGGFKTPSLLRRATTNTASLGANDRGVTTSLSRENSASSTVKMGGTKKSSLAYQAREGERRAIVEASTKRRAENTARIAQLRRNASGGVGKGLGGKFE
ncbi:Mediator of replication checkpoint protein 1 [Pseudocercospora fuligena]|uniref:Mediator of replication checkpoint protein 1 n=1 Tax=Pseudocercospora fuligena TaxID=685502 RepID=A0A8H6VH02_9PEZI|nr:Mediator of replication checkpoint protein 1 [Pseudocercospora fuligena]